MSLPDIALRSSLTSRSISAENPTGGAGAGARAVVGNSAVHARDLGEGWKVSPNVTLTAGTETCIADIRGSGLLQHLWMAVRPEYFRRLVIRFYWDDRTDASIAVPIGDFFCLGWDAFTPFSSKFVVAAPYCGLNAYWPMPFRAAARVTVENLWHEDVKLFYSLDYGLGAVPDDAMYLHATWRRSPVVIDGIHVLMDVSASGKYVGTYMAVGVAHPGWWGEGEFKFFLDGDDDYPTIVGTGTEDFFGGAWDFVMPDRRYREFASSLCGLPQVLVPDGLFASQTRFGMYRWHESDGVNFSSSLRVVVQNLGWMPDGRYLLRRDDVATTAFWYSGSPQDPGSDALTYPHLLVSSA